MEGTLAAYKTEHDKLTNEFGHSIDYYAHKQALASKGVTSAAVRTWISDNYICQHPAKYRPDEVAYAAQRRNTITANASPHETALQRLYEARKFTPQDEYLVEQKASQKQQLKTQIKELQLEIESMRTTLAQRPAGASDLASVDTALIVFTGVPMPVTRADSQNSSRSRSRSKPRRQSTAQAYAPAYPGPAYPSGSSGYSGDLFRRNSGSQDRQQRRTSTGYAAPPPVPAAPVPLQAPQRRSTTGGQNTFDMSNMQRELSTTGYTQAPAPGYSVQYQQPRLLPQQQYGNLGPATNSQGQNPVNNHGGQNQLARPALAIPPYQNRSGYQQPGPDPRRRNSHNPYGYPSYGPQ